MFVEFKWHSCMSGPKRKDSPAEGPRERGKALVVGDSINRARIGRRRIGKVQHVC